MPPPPLPLSPPLPQTLSAYVLCPCWIRYLEYDRTARIWFRSSRIETVNRQGEFRMESQPLRLCGIGQLLTEFLPDTRIPRVEVIYPQPRRVVKVPPILDCVGSLGSKAKCNLPAQQGDHNNRNFFDIFFNKDETGDDQTGFFCGSPPVRTDNPMVWDSFFTKENLAFSPTIIHESRGQHGVEENQQFIGQHKTRIGYSEHYQHQFCS